MSLKVVSGAGVGAAAVVVGLWLAGPQALGVANADTAATDSMSVSAGPAEPGSASGDESSPARPGAGRGGRGVKPSESVVSGVRPRASADVTSVRQIPAGEAVRGSVRASVSVKPAAAVPEVAVAVPSAAAVVADPVRVPAREQRGAAVREEESLDASQEALVALQNFFDTSSDWVETLPAGPVTDFLSGALLSTRSALFPDGAGFGASSGGVDGQTVCGFKGCRYVSAISAQVPGQGWYHNAKRWVDITGLPRPTILGTSGAPIISWIKNGQYSNDGVQGMITNKTPDPIVVMVGTGNEVSDQYPKAILLPNDWMPYQLNEEGNIFIYRYSGDASPDPIPYSNRYVTVTLKDPFTFIERPSVSFQGPSGYREDPRSFSEGDVWTFTEVWTSTNSGWNSIDNSIWVRREHDGWYVRTSQEYFDLFRDPNKPETSDWAIFNINVLKLEM
jgi:hypothetical protein